jgi:hypothetical protein
MAHRVGVSTREHSVSDTYPPQKYVCRYKKLAKFSKIAFSQEQKSEKEFDKLTFGNREFVECETSHFL